ncbi:hemicentin-1-like [Ostrinia nubilalis]|uniref:hemicentin-1-like n=1 Tax=Ostrinia nubilalis TaxID=29057 RepID=UPI0030823D91
MAWAVTTLILAAAFSAAFADEVEDSQPLLYVLARPSVFNVGDRRAIFCKGINIEDEINWYSPSGEVVKERNNLSSRTYVERKVEGKEVKVPLIFHELKISDSGKWTCKAGNYNETVEFIVGSKVKIVNRTENKIGEEGKSIKMDCEAKGHPMPVVQWYRNQNPINADSKNNKYIIRKKGDLYTMEIKDLSYEDIGDYVCKVTQKALSHYIDKTITLSVKHGPILRTYETVETYAILNETKNITCSAFAFPPPEYEWIRTRDNFDSPIPEDDIVFTDKDGTYSVLSLRVRSEEDLGQYKCKVSNNKGSKTVVFDVSLGNKPPPPDSVTLLSANGSALVFNVSCSQCNFQKEEEGVSPPPSNLTVIAFEFQLTPAVEDYLPDWDAAFEIFTLDITDDRSYVVGPLPNSTTFHARVRSLNIAGYSDWTDISPSPSTTAHAIRLLSSAALLVFTVVALWF